VVVIVKEATMMKNEPRNERTAHSALNRHRTSAGVEIGIAYIKPPKREIGACAEQIQTALLKPGEVRHHGHMRPDPRMRLRALPQPIELDNSLAARIARGRAHLYLLCALALANAFGRLKD
jgi:hypothetical protein